MGQKIYKATAADGWVRNWDADWATVRSASAGLAVNNTNTPADLFDCWLWAGVYNINRGAVFFDTSADPIPSDATGITATLKFYCTGKNGTDSVHAVTYGLTSITNLSDYAAANWGSNSAGSKAWADIAINDFFSFSINPAIITITKNGLIVIGLRCESDRANIAPTGDNSLGVRMSEHVGTDYDPELTVNYTEGDGCTFGSSSAFAIKPTGGWPSGAFGARKAKLLAGSSAGAQTDYQKRLILYEKTGTPANSDEMYCDGMSLNFPEDIRFYTDDAQPISQWFEGFDKGRQIPGGNTTYNGTVGERAVRFTGTYDRTYFTYYVWATGKQWVNYYDHDTKSFGTAVCVVTDAVPDNHNPASIAVSPAGRLWLCRSIVGSPYGEIYKANVDESIAAWTQKAYPASNSGYPTLHFSGSVVYCFMSGQPGDWSFVWSKSLDGGDTWSSSITWKAAGGALWYDLRRRTFNGKIHIPWTENAGSDFYQSYNVYYTYFDPATEHFYTAGGVDLGPVITAGAETTACLAYDSGTSKSYLPSIVVDSTGKVVIAANIVETSRTNYKYAVGSSTYIVRWNGSAWSSAKLADAIDTQSSIGMFSDSDIRVWLWESGGTLGEYQTVDAGANFTRLKTISKCNRNQIESTDFFVQNGTAACYLMYHTLDSYGPLTPGGYPPDAGAWLYGSEMLEGRAVVVVKAPTVPASPSKAVVWMYMSLLGAAYESNVANTFAYGQEFATDPAITNPSSNYYEIATGLSIPAAHRLWMAWVYWDSHEEVGGHQAYLGLSDGSNTEVIWLNHASVTGPRMAAEDMASWVSSKFVGDLQLLHPASGAAAGTLARNNEAMGTYTAHNYTPTKIVFGTSAGSPFSSTVAWKAELGRVYVKTWRTAAPETWGEFYLDNLLIAKYVSPDPAWGVEFAAEIASPTVFQDVSSLYDVAQITRPYYYREMVTS